MQRYISPHKVAVPPGMTGVMKSRKRYLERDGQIVPCLVIRQEDGSFIAADTWQGETVLACRELGWDTILIEDEFTEDDL